MCCMNRPRPFVRLFESRVTSEEPKYEKLVGARSSHDEAWSGDARNAVQDFNVLYLRFERKALFDCRERENYPAALAEMRYESFGAFKNAPANPDAHSYVDSWVGLKGISFDQSCSDFVDFAA